MCIFFEESLQYKQIEHDWAKNCVSFGSYNFSTFDFKQT